MEPRAREWASVAVLAIVLALLVVGIVLAAVPH